MIMASIYSIVYQPVGQNYDEDRQAYIRVPFQRANLVADFGIEGDQKAGHNPKRQLNLLALEWLAEKGAVGYKAEPGQFGEQLILSGLDLASVPLGTRLRLGETASIELVQPRTGCTRLEVAQGKSIDSLGPVGMMAHVITGGPIAVGDPVTVLETSPVEPKD